MSGSGLRTVAMQSLSVRYWQDAQAGVIWSSFLLVRVWAMVTAPRRSKYAWACVRVKEPAGSMAQRWLEIAPTSNVQTGAAASIAAHPIGLLTDLKFRVTVNTDNRLMSNVSMTSEMTALVEAFGYDWARLQWFTINAMKSAFLPFDERLLLIEGTIKPGYAALMA